MKYTVSVRKSVEDWEEQTNEWTDEYYSDPFIEAESPEGAEDIAREFIQDCGYSPDEYDFLVDKYEE